LSGALTTFRDLFQLYYFRRNGQNQLSEKKQVAFALSLPSVFTLYKPKMFFAGLLMRCMRRHDPDTSKSRARSSITGQTLMRGISTSGLRYTPQQSEDMTSFFGTVTLNVSQIYMHLMTRAKHHRNYYCKGDIERWQI